MAGFAMLMIASIAAFGQQADAATRVPILIDEPQPGRTVAWPVTTGVPFARDTLHDPAHCRLIDEQGRPQALQARVAATWDRERTSIRWLTLDFVAQPQGRYFLEFGPDVRGAEIPSGLTVTSGDVLSVDTGALRTEFTQQGATSIGRILADLDGDGTIRGDEQVAAGAADGEHYYLDQQGRRFSTAGDADQRSIVVESRGPVRTTVRVDGYYTGPKQERIVQYRTRYHFFAGLPLIKVVDEFRIVGSTRGVQFADIGFALDLTGEAQSRTVAAAGSSKPGSETVNVAWTADTKAVSSYQSTYRHYGNPEFEAAVVHVDSSGEHRLRQSDRSGAWMQVTDDRSAVTGSLRWFWQQFPKAWEATPGRLTLHLWSPRGGSLDFSAAGIKRFVGPAGEQYLVNWPKARAGANSLNNFFYYAGREQIRDDQTDGRGINKHHEFTLHFAPAAQADAGQSYGRLTARQPLALASGAWNTGTDVFGPLAPRGAASQPASTSRHEAIVDRLFDLSRYAQDAFGDYGWWLFGAGPHYSYQWDPAARRHYADPRRFDFHTYQKETQLWWCYLRSGERKFYDWALPSENHWVDVAVSHVPLTYDCNWRGGDPLERTLHWPAGDWAIDGPIHYLRHHDTAEAWLRGGSQFWATYHRTLETTSLAYYLTGDARFADVLEYWRAYWAPLAGKTSASSDVPEQYRQQAWFQPTRPGEPERTWAEMIRDYAPFSSGSRHQMTLFFSLATLYEHTWDPKIGQVLREYADAFLDPAHPIGVWRSQENRTPANADAPTMAHFWTPALWKYGRATGDPRIKQIMPRFFAAGYACDPFLESQRVGVYSNVHLGYAYYFTGDARHLRLAAIELDRLQALAAPLARPEDLGPRLYNPYAPIRALTATPRLRWALDAAQRRGVKLPAPPPLQPQRTAIALSKAAGKPLSATLWGYDARLKIFGPDARETKAPQVETRRHASQVQPFDRILPQYAVYMHQLTIPADSPAGVYVLSPKLELGIVELSGAGPPCFSAALPAALRAGQCAYVRIAPGAAQLQFEAVKPNSLQVAAANGQPLPVQVTGTRAKVEVDGLAGDHIVCIKNVTNNKVWFRLVGWPDEQCWAALDKRALAVRPDHKLTLASLRRRPVVAPDALYPPGRFGKGAHVTSERRLHLPDHLEVDGQAKPLFDRKQGTIEFWVKRLWDERLTPVRRVVQVDNGLVQAYSPWSLPLGEWAHVAVVWRPFKRDPSETCVHIYINGHDRTFYRSVWWPGYGNRPIRFSSSAKWLKEFLVRAPVGAAFMIDELRVSTTPRYANLDIQFGPQQTFNPVTFDPPTQPFTADEHTTLLFHFDENLRDASGEQRRGLQGRWSDGKK